MATTTKKKTTAAAKVKEPVVDIVEKEIEEVEVAPVVTEAPKAKTAKKYAPDDLILTRSTTAGTLLLVGKKTRARYMWAGYDDTQYVEYQDLISEMLTNSPYVYRPLFVIEDEELLADHKWDRLRKMYDNLYAGEDIKELLDLPYGRFAAILPNLPAGLKNAVKTTVATLIERGEFDSLNKVKLIDEVCGTDLKCLFS